MIEQKDVITDVASLTKGMLVDAIDELYQQVFDAITKQCDERDAEASKADELAEMVKKLIEERDLYRENANEHRLCRKQENELKEFYLRKVERGEAFIRDGAVWVKRKEKEVKMW